MYMHYLGEDIYGEFYFGYNLLNQWIHTCVVYFVLIFLCILRIYQVNKSIYFQAKYFSNVYSSFLIHDNFSTSWNESCIQTRKLAITDLNVWNAFLSPFNFVAANNRTFWISLNSYAKWNGAVGNRYYDPGLFLRPLN